MKTTIIILFISLLSIPVFAQDNPAKTIDNTNTYTAYMLMQQFINSTKDHPGIFSTSIKPQWNSKIFNDQYNQLLDINKKKEFYPVLLFDNRFVAQSIPMKNGSPNYMWVTTQQKYKSFGEEIANDIITNMLTPKKYRSNSNQHRKGYYTAIGMKY